MPFGSFSQPGRAQPLGDAPRLPGPHAMETDVEVVLADLRSAAKRFGIRPDSFFAGARARPPRPRDRPRGSAG
jgi:hypothetical protein